ncbi:hypothetical protein ABK040_013572 [Willaertia magna]
MQQREQEERQVKKRKSLLEYYFTLEVLSEITKYFNNPKDYIYLAQACKYFYEILLLKENYLFKQFNEILFNNLELTLTNDLPEYLFKLKKLHISSCNNNYELLKNFINAIILKTDIIPEKYLQYLPNLEELIIYKIKNLNENTFTNLKQLKVLSVSSDKLQDEWLKNLNNLTELSIHNGEKITGSCLQYFKNLTVLYLSACDTIKDEMLLNCKQLTNININACNKITGNYFKELKELKHLNISYCDDITDECLNNLNNLESLVITKCENITGICLQNLKQLKSLTIEGSNVTQLKHLSNLINLNNLKIKIETNEINNSNISYDTSFLFNLINLEFLKIKFYDYNFVIREKDFYNLKNLKNLKIIHTEYNFPDFTGKCFQFFTKLEKLSCNYEFELNYLYYLTNIKYLNLTNIKNIYFNEEFSHFKKLEKLKINSEIIINDKLNDLQLFTNLKHLIIEYSTIIGDFDNLPNLTALKLFAVEIKDKQIINLENLTKLKIYKCPSITGKCFLNLKNLQNLKISSCDNINFKYLSNLKKLTNLNVSDSDIEDKDLMELNNMKYLNVTYCPKLVSGTFLFSMNKLIHLVCLEDEDLNKIEIDKVKDEIKKGRTFEQAITEVMGDLEI